MYFHWIASGFMMLVIKFLIAFTHLNIIGQLLEIKWWNNDIKDLSGIKFDKIEVAIAQVKAINQKRKR